MRARAGATDFFDRQERAQRTTWRLAVLFPLVFVLLCAGTYIFFLVTMDFVFILGAGEPFLVESLLSSDEAFGDHLRIVAAAIVATAIFVGVGSLVKTRSLKQGGAVVAESVGGEEVNIDDEDGRVRRYVNIVEEMSLASGVPVPRVFVMRNQRGINGFAAGYSMDDAAIAVTEGALRYLTRDELQALVAHEFSHILHGDMRINLRLIGVLYGVMSIYLAGRTVVDMAHALADTGARAGSQAAKYQGVVKLQGLIMGIPGLLLMGAGIAGLAGSRLIKAGITRQREFLADAAAVQFTRNPLALAGALKKIGGCPEGSELEGSRAEEVSHMCFGEASSTVLTHPSLEKRILAVDPSFNPELGFAVLGEKDVQQVSPEEERRRARKKSGSELDQIADVVSHIGEATPETLAYCVTLLDSMPEEIRKARGALAGAVAMAYLLLINGEQEAQKEQAQIIQEETAPSVAREARRLWPVVKKLDERLRLPLMDLIFATLRQMTQEQYEEFVSVAERLIEADGGVSFQEFILERLLLQRLERARNPAKKRGAQFHVFSRMSRDLGRVLSAMAHAGAQDVQEIERAFEVGRRSLPRKVIDEVAFVERSQWSFRDIGESMERLASSSPAIRRAAIEALAHCVMADETVEVAEAELLRAFSDLLGSPLPPIVRVPTSRQEA